MAWFFSEPAAPWVARFLRLGYVAAGVLVVLAMYKIWRADEGYLFGFSGIEIGRWQKSARWKEVERAFAELRNNSDKQRKVINVAELLAADWAYLNRRDHNLTREDIDRILEGVVSGLPPIMSSLGNHRCSLLVPDETGNYLVIRAAKGYREEERFQTRVRIDSSSAGEVFRLGRPKYSENLVEDPWVPLPEAPEPYRSRYAVPLRVGGAVHGVLIGDAEEPDAFNEDDKYYVRVIATFATIALQREPSLHSNGGGGGG